MTGDHPRDEHVDPSAVDGVPADREAAAAAGSDPHDVDPHDVDPHAVGPAPHRPHLWLAVFLIVVGLTVIVTIVGFVTDDRSSWGVAVPAATGAVAPGPPSR